MKHILTISFLLCILVGSLRAQDVTLNTVEANGANTGSVTAIVNDPLFDYSFEWTDSEGNLITPQPNCNDFDCTLTNLNPGRYCVRIASSGSECDEDKPSEAYGCVDVEGVSCNTDFSFYFEYSDPACSNTNEGFITFHFDDPDLCWLFGDNTFKWDDGTLDRTKSNLQPGSKHCITIRADEDDSCPDCYAHLCTEVPALDTEPLTVDGWKGDICYSEILHESDKPHEASWIELVKGYGWIFANSSGGYGNKSIRWLDDDSNSWNRIINNPGVYCAEISDECGNSVIKCWEIVILYVDQYCLAPYFPELFESHEFRLAVESIRPSWGNFDSRVAVNNEVDLALLNSDINNVKYSIIANEKGIEIGILQLIDGDKSNTTIEERRAENHYSIMDGITVYPNPSNGLFNVNITSESERTTEIGIFSVDGKLLQSVKVVLSIGQNERIIDIGRLGEGIYLLKIGDKTPMKIIVNK